MADSTHEIHASQPVLALPAERGKPQRPRLSTKIHNHDDDHESPTSSPPGVRFFDKLLEAAISPDEVDLLSPTVLAEPGGVAWTSDHFTDPESAQVLCRLETQWPLSPEGVLLPSISERKTNHHKSYERQSGVVPQQDQSSTSSPTGSDSSASLTPTDLDPSPLSYSPVSYSTSFTSSENSPLPASPNPALKPHTHSPQQRSPKRDTMRNVKLPEPGEKAALSSSRLRLITAPISAVLSHTFHAILHEKDLYLAACVGSALFYVVAVVVAYVLRLKLYFTSSEKVSSGTTIQPQVPLLSATLWELRLLATLWLSTVASRALIASRLALSLSSTLARWRALAQALLHGPSLVLGSRRMYAWPAASERAATASGGAPLGSPGITQADEVAQSASSSRNDVGSASRPDMSTSREQEALRAKPFAKKIVPYIELLMELTLPPVMYLLMKVFGTVLVTALLSAALSIHIYSLRRPALETCAFGTLFAITAVMSFGLLQQVLSFMLSENPLAQLRTMSSVEKINFAQGLTEYATTCFVVAVNIAQDMHTTHPWLERQMKSSSKRRARMFYISWFGSVILMTVAMIVTGGTFLPATYFALREVYHYFRDRVPLNYDD